MLNHFREMCKNIKKIKNKPRFGATTEPGQSKKRDNEREGLPEFIGVIDSFPPSRGSFSHCCTFFFFPLPPLVLHLTCGPREVRLVPSDWLSRDFHMLEGRENEFPVLALFFIEGNSGMRPSHPFLGVVEEGSVPMGGGVAAPYVKSGFFR